MVVYCDNTSTIRISENPVQDFKTKPIEICYHFIRELVEEKVVSLSYVSTESQLADILTKSVDSATFHNLIKSLGVCLVE